MFVTSRFTSSLMVVIALSSAALAGCGDSPRQEGLTRAAPTMVVVERPAPPAAPPAAVASAPAQVAREAQRDKPQRSTVATSKPKGDGKALSVKKLVLATQVEKARREPKGVGQSFKQGDFEQLYAFVELANPGDEAQVLVSFEPPSAKAAKGNVRLDVGTSPRWRTWASSRALDEKGEWAAVVTAPDGRELAREKFVIL